MGEYLSFISWIWRLGTLCILTVLVPTIVFTWRLTSTPLRFNLLWRASVMNTFVDWSSRTAYVKVSLRGSDWSDTFNKIILAQEWWGLSLYTRVQVDEAWLQLCSGLDGSWWAVTWLLPHILHWRRLLSQCLLMCLFELAQLKQNPFLNRKSFRSLKSSSQNFWQFSRSWDLVLW